MTDISDLKELADKDGIAVDYISCPECGSMSLLLDGNCYIGIDKNVESDKELVCFAHELGHCETGAFYNRYSKFDVISKHEYKADKWAVQRLMPVEELLSAVEKGYTEAWELAEYFGVTEDFVRRAYEIYTAMGVL